MPEVTQDVRVAIAVSWGKVSHTIQDQGMPVAADYDCVRTGIDPWARLIEGLAEKLAADLDQDGMTSEFKARVVIPERLRSLDLRSLVLACLDRRREARRKLMLATHGVRNPCWSV